MLAFKRVRKITGELEVTATGLSPEKLLNLAAKNHISLSGVRRLSYTQLCFNIGPADYNRLKKLLPEGRYKLNIGSSRGLSLMLYAFRARYCLIAGIIISIVLAFFASSRIWFVKVRGCEKVSEENVLQLLESYGLKSGASVSGEELDEMEKRLMQDISDISWVGISRRGVNIYAYIKESSELPESTPIDKPADVIALKDGVVEKVTVLQGRAVVTQGQTVRAGDVLISGELIYQDLPYQYIYALGDVQARIWYSGERKISLVQSETVRTGNTAVVRTMRIFGQDIPLDGENPFASYEVESREQDVMNLGIPVTIITQTYYETEEREYSITQEEALELGKSDLEQELSAQIPQDAEILRTQSSVKAAEGENAVIVSMFIETLEQIGQTKELTG
ncbi:MAG TPA: sporulation protein YqfD [Firmicutes bacterium]|nr:sporulation protein YqfD [Bacillota bacterium]